MYWVNKNHEQNFILLQKKFPQIANPDYEFASACYCASHPEIFKVFNHQLDELIHGPFDWAILELENLEIYIFRAN